MDNLRKFFVDTICPGKQPNKVLEMFCLFCYNTTRNMISLKAYTNWINKAPKTARISYYRGYLCDPKLGSISPSDNTRVFRLRKLVQDSQEDNLVTLVQKRHGDFDYEYIAVRT